MHPLVNITVTSYNRLEHTRRCITSLQSTAGVSHVITVVDNNSTDGSCEYLLAAQAQGLIHNLYCCRCNMGVAVASNLGWAMGRQHFHASHYVKLDNDVVVLRPDWLQTLFDLLTPDFGSIGYYIEPSRLESGPCFTVPHVVGSCILIPDATYARLGFWNEEYGLYGIEDSDFSTRVTAAGLLNAYVAGSEHFIRHDHGLYAGNGDLDHEIRQVQGLSNDNTALFYFNNALFLSGTRALRVERKFLPHVVGHEASFVSNPAHTRQIAPFIEARRDFIEAHRQALLDERKDREDAIPNLMSVRAF